MALNNLSGRHLIIVSHFDLLNVSQLMNTKRKTTLGQVDHRLLFSLFLIVIFIDLGSYMDTWHNGEVWASSMPVTCRVNIIRNR